MLHSLVPGVWRPGACAGIGQVVPHVAKGNGADMETDAEHMCEGQVVRCNRAYPTPPCQ